MQPDRRKFIKRSLTTAAGIAAHINHLHSSPLAMSHISKHTGPPAQSIRFSVIGLNHGHIYAQTDAVIRGGGKLVSFYAKEADLAAEFSKRYPEAKSARSEAEILEDNTIQLVVSASIPVERAPLGIRAMRHNKDFMVDKPGIISLEQLAEVKQVQKETGKIYSIMYSERLENPTTIKAGELITAGAIGKVVQTIGLGPHRMNASTRPSWFFDTKYYGGILCDIASHQCDQFLFFTGSTRAEIIASQVGNVHHPQYPAFEDFGDATLRGDGGTGYFRVDWFTPRGLTTWGDGRLTVLGTEGYMELRKYVDVGGREGGNHLFVVDQKSTRYIDCNHVPLPYGEQLVSDILNRTETAMSQEHCFLAAELAIKAQQAAQKLILKK